APTVPLTSIHSTILDSRASYRSHSNKNCNSYSSFSRRNFEQRITTIKNQETLPRYQISNSIYFEKKFPRQSVYSRKSQWFRKAFIIFIIGFIGLYLIYSWLTFKDLSNYFLITPQVAHINGQILLYRILGNDLPPRHKTGQTLKNLRFILEHESDFLNTKKWWILNRIVNSEYEDAIINLLKLHNQDYIRIPFNEQEYLKCDFRLEDFPEPDFFHSNDFMNFSKVSKLRAIDYSYHEKNLYAINNNGGRNAALAHGKSQQNVSWILPFDGNCFLTPNSFADIRTQLNKWGDRYKYFIVPMARLLNNSQLLDGLDTRPLAPEEPQIIFRYDYNKTFNENMRYGRRSKLDMLWRLGVPSTSRNANKSSAPWEPSYDPYKVVEKDQYKSIGWVFRLFSGQASQELNQRESSALRSFNRLLAVQELIDGIDERIARKVQGFDPFRLLLYDEKLLNNARLNYWLEVPEVVEIVQVLIKRADEMLSITTNLFKSDHRDVQDTFANFLKTNDYNLYNQHIDSVDDIQNLHLDITNKDYFEKFFTPDSFFENITTLTLAHYFSGNEKYAKWAGNLIQTFILSSYNIGDHENLESPYLTGNSESDSINSEGYSFPNINTIPRIIPKFLKVGTSSFLNNITDSDPSFFLDACRLLYRTNILTRKEYTKLRLFASEWLETLINSSEYIKIANNSDHRSVIYDFRVLSLAAFVDDLRLYLRIVNRVRMRIGKQFYISNNTSTNEMKQIYEINYVQNLLDTNEIKPSDYDENIFRYTTLNLQYWLLLIRSTQNGLCGPDIWQYTAKGGQRISKASIEHLKRYSNRMHDISLVHIAKNAYMINKSKRCTRQESKYELEYLQNLENIGNIRDIIPSNLIDDENLNTRIGLGNEARQRGLPPFWILGVA
ncbi:10257_t:CDS:2, partial [Scutellospora calospora]